MEEEEANLAGIVLKKVKSQGLMMSRVPQRIRDNFVRLAEEEFAGDYGMALSFLWDKFELLSSIMQSWDTKLNYIIELLSQDKSSTEKKLGKKMMSGRIVEKEV